MNNSNARTFSLAAYPLCWPRDWKRTNPSGRRNSVFKKYGKTLQIGEAIKRILEQLSLMGIKRDDCLVSTNLQTRLDGLPRADQCEPQDPGAAVYWRRTQNDPMRCMAIDRYETVAGNLGAIAATLEAMRAIERHGGAEILERTFTGFAALPASTSKPWREVMGLEWLGKAGGGISEVAARYKALARERHPDMPRGSEAAMTELNAAYEEARKELA
jgi:hypothetical protein